MTHQPTTVTRHDNNPPDSQTQQVTALFDYWRTIHQHPNAQLDTKRHRVIAKALQQGYSPTQCQQAILGCRLSPFHQGDNPRGQCYDHLSLIFRDAEHIERFIALSQSPQPRKFINAEYTSYTSASALDQLARHFEAEYGTIEETAQRVS